MIAKLEEMVKSLKSMQLNLPEIETKREVIYDLLEEIVDLSLRMQTTVMDTVVEPDDTADPND